ncbi:hypothetical protein LMJ53_09055 [Rheinheimera sp. UJ51]|uniref:DUF6868 family protein n=1 Tax=Rheinheimera sp. UJ51 TaxID=2892446 RepID=UPI001E3E1EA1|nr:hypothetical protein [Rheinheimera sp. UJ51]MCC5451870.1 hypothetical protein [Rheinheimera sp. UJ51]
MTLSQLTELLGWAALLNLAYLTFVSLMLMLGRNFAIALHQKFFDLDAAALQLKFYAFLSHYKVITLTFFVAPYLALKIMGF